MNMQTSANLNVMVKAGRSLLKNSQDVENLQVSVKGAGDFVTKSDIAAEKIIKAELLQARPTYGWIGEDGGAIDGGLRRLPKTALPAIAISRTAPPTSVLRLAVSLSKSQTQSGPSRTSASESKASSAAGRLRDPRV
jgi:3'-phosphoadenosine 5'-phosphosulfate (PAPS) 3'-phosphatase